MQHPAAHQRATGAQASSSGVSQLTATMQSCVHAAACVMAGTTPCRVLYLQMYPKSCTPNFGPMTLALT